MPGKPRHSSGPPRPPRRRSQGHPRPPRRRSQGPPRPPRLRLPALPALAPPLPLPALPAGEGGAASNPCAGCDRCCRYVALQIDKPVDKEDFDQIRWYVLHRGVSVYIDAQRDWYIQFDTQCDWLQHGVCTHYELRPSVCREYSVETCERYGEGLPYAVLIGNEAELEAYLDRRWRRRGRRSGTRRRRAG